LAFIQQKTLSLKLFEYLASLIGQKELNFKLESIFETKIEEASNQRSQKYVSVQSQDWKSLFKVFCCTISCSTFCRSNIIDSTALF